MIILVCSVYYDDEKNSWIEIEHDLKNYETKLKFQTILSLFPKNIKVIGGNDICF